MRWRCAIPVVLLLICVKFRGCLERFRFRCCCYLGGQNVPVPAHVFFIANRSRLDMSNLEEVLRLPLKEKSQEFGHRNEKPGACVHSKVTHSIMRLCSLRKDSLVPSRQERAGVVSVVAPSALGSQQGFQTKRRTPSLKPGFAFRLAVLDISICISVWEKPGPLLGSWKRCVNVPNWL